MHGSRITDGLINYINTKAKGRHLKNLPAKDLVAGVHLSVLYPPPPHYTLYTYMYLFTPRRGRGESSTREKGRGATDHKAGLKIPA